MELNDACALSDITVLVLLALPDQSLQALLLLYFKLPMKQPEENWKHLFEMHSRISQKRRNKILTKLLQYQKQEKKYMSIMIGNIF